MENKFEFIYASENIGTLTVSHIERSESNKNNLDFDSFAIHDEKGKWLANVAVALETKPANAIKIIFDAIEALDYAG